MPVHGPACCCVLSEASSSSLSGILVFPGTLSPPFENNNRNAFFSASFPPLPAEDYTAVSTSDHALIQRIELFDIHGKLVRKWENVHSNEVIIGTSDFHSGIYFIRINAGNDYIGKMIIK
jgi:hypothetical protein